MNRLDGKVAFLDFGMTKRLDIEQIELEQIAVDAAVHKDPEALRVELADLGFVKNPTKLDAERLMDAVMIVGGWYLEDREYRVFGYKGKQVRDNIHSADLVAAFEAYRANPRPAAVYNIGGGRASNCSMLEAIEACERIAGRELNWEMGPEPRIGDHRWWISDLAPFEADYPGWSIRYGIDDILTQMYEQNVERWTAAPA